MRFLKIIAIKFYIMYNHYKLKSVCIIIELPDYSDIDLRGLN